MPLSSSVADTCAAVGDDLSQLSIFFTNAFHLPHSQVLTRVSACVQQGAGALGGAGGTGTAIDATDVFLQLVDMVDKQETGLPPPPPPPPPPPSSTSSPSSCQCLHSCFPFVTRHHAAAHSAESFSPPSPTPSSLFSALALIHSKLLFVWRSRRLRVLGVIKDYEGIRDADIYLCLRSISLGIDHGHHHIRKHQHHHR